MEQKINAKNLEVNINEMMKGVREHKRSDMMMIYLFQANYLMMLGVKLAKNCGRLCEEKATSMETLHGQRHTAYLLFEFTMY